MINPEGGIVTLTRAALESDPSVVYFLDRHLRHDRCNAAWDRFALDNSGSHLLRESMAGYPILEAMPPTLTGFYSSMYQSVLASGEPVCHEYECSSDTEYRLIHLRVLRNPTELGLILINSPVFTHPHGPERPPHPPPGHVETVSMCAHCRRTRLDHPPHDWVWVPDFVRNPPARVSHLICNLCLAVNYPEVLIRRALKGR